MPQLRRFIRATHKKKGFAGQPVIACNTTPLRLCASARNNLTFYPERAA